MTEPLDLRSTLRQGPPEDADPRRRHLATVVVVAALPVLVLAGAAIGTVIDGPDDPVRLGMVLGLFAWIGTVGFVLMADSGRYR